MGLLHYPIITYHSVEDYESPLFVSPARLKAQLAALAEHGYQSISLTTLFDGLRQNSALPDRAVVITFDDGYASVYEAAWPILSAYGYTATVFLVTDYCGSDNQWPGQPANVPSRPLMTWAQVQELASAGFEFGAHTRTHAPLPALSENQALDEIIISKQEIQNHTGQQVTSFAYPYGAVASTIANIVQRNFGGAVGVRLGMVTENSDIYGLERIDAYYLSPGLVRYLHRPQGRIYLRLRQTMRDIRRLAQRDWQPVPARAG
jgi:peptidoglycan/xylan/chitin deacetylase (PgdA/CDA1 family)